LPGFAIILKNFYFLTCTFDFLLFTFNLNTMSKYSLEDLELLKKYVTNPEGDIFCVQNLTGLTGAVYARYSRAKGSFKDTLLKEFIKEGQVDINKAEELIQRVLVAYGDDSVGELEGAHLSFENISMLATKEFEERRIGGSPIEQSTRYVFYDEVDEHGNYRYYFDPKIKNSPHDQAYKETMDFIFKTYCDLIEPMKEFYSKLKPVEEAEYDINGDGQKEKIKDLTNEKDIKSFKRTYGFDVRTKACDTLRNILPIATKTNVGLFGNGRFYQNILIHLYSSPYGETQDMARQAHQELNKLIPQYVKRAKKNDYLVANHQNTRTLATELFKDIQPETDEAVVLLDKGEDTLANLINQKIQSGHKLTENDLRQMNQAEQDNFTVASMLYPYLGHPFRQIRKKVRELPDETKQKIIKTYVGQRGHRRNKPSRAFEMEYSYIFDLVTDWGTYKDLMRHRMNSQLRQQFTPKLGFTMPQDLIEAGYDHLAQKCVDRAIELYDLLVKDFTAEASYATLHGCKTRWLLGMNCREAFHLLELRSTPQGHPLYRQAAQKMHQLISDRCQWRGEIMEFVDHNDYFWSRADSEARQRVKEKELDEKYKS